MTRATALILAAAALIALSPTGPRNAQAQQQPLSIELNQSVLDRWLVAIPAIVKLGQSSPALQTDDAARQHVERICAEAGFDSYPQCAEVIGYVGMIISACDRRSRRFSDPIPMMRRALERLEADSGMPLADKEARIREMRQVLAAFPDRLPDAHIRLLNANRDRIFAAVNSTMR